MKTYRRVLTIAGSDSGGGAGIQADLKTFAALECYGMSVIAALTAQNTIGVSAIYDVPPSFVDDQLQAVLSDIGVDAVKIGMLQSEEVISVVADRLRQAQIKQIVLDPVMVAKSGHKLLKDSAIGALRTKLMPLATLVTPHIPEADVLTGIKIDNRDDMMTAAEKILSIGTPAVLVKGGHLSGDSADDLLAISSSYTPPATKWFHHSRIATSNTHGTGCTLSSAIAAHLARGNDITTAVTAAIDYLTRAITEGAAFKIGHGHGPVHHFAAKWHNTI
jgi:hydroxymethylpyrimidine/phosphomethylpyrimidine kinase